MGIVVAVSNYLVQFPVEATLAGLALGEYITYAAFTYPIAFLVTDTANRLFGAQKARQIVYFGFALGVVLSLLAATDSLGVRIALASGTAFLTAQLLDVFVFDRLRSGTWWRAPLISSFLGSIVDTVLFFSLAFAGTGIPWQTLAIGDFAVKILMMATLLPIFRVLMSLFPKSQPA